jgi:cytochrome P450
MTLAPFHPFSLEYTANPQPYFAEFHSHGRLVEHEEFGAWFAHDYETVRAFCDHPQMSRRPRMIPSLAEGAAERLERWPLIESGMGAQGNQDGESNDQLVLRKVLAPDFRPGTIRKMRATVRDVVAKHCAPLQWEKELDVVKLVQTVPLSVISQLLGIGDSGPNAELFLTSGPDLFRGIGPLVSDEAKDRAEVAAHEMIQVLTEEVADRRAHPRDDMISHVIEVAEELDGVDPDQVVSTLVILVAAGTDTTRLTTSLAIKTLLNHPEELERLRANRESLPNAIMELLRYEGATKFLARSTHEDVEWKGQTIPADSVVLISILGAGWDPKVFDNPSRLDATRDLRGSLSFGFGRGYCLGAHLARLQLRELIDFFIEHMPPGASLDSDAMTWEPNNIFLREIRSMPIQLR